MQGFSQDQPKSLTQKKTHLRKKMRQKRKILKIKTGEKAAQKLWPAFLELQAQKKISLTNKIIAGYWPSGSEITPQFLLLALQKAGALLTLPVIERPELTQFAGSETTDFIKNTFSLKERSGSLKKNSGNSFPLKFRFWEEKTPLRRGKHGIHEPFNTSYMHPEILLLPLLAFDRFGNRLGQGGGYYDRTLWNLRKKTQREETESNQKIEKMRQKQKILAIGLAFSGQEVSDIPTGSHDEKLDAVLTEKGFIPFVK